MEEAERLCDRVAIVDHGRVIALGTPRELIATLGAEHVVEFGLAEGSAIGRTGASRRSGASWRCATRRDAVQTPGGRAAHRGLPALPRGSRAGRRAHRAAHPLRHARGCLRLSHRDGTCAMSEPRRPFARSCRSFSSRGPLPRVRARTGGGLLDVHLPRSCWPRAWALAFRTRRAGVVKVAVVLDEPPGGASGDFAEWATRRVLVDAAQRQRRCPSLRTAKSRCWSCRAATRSTYRFDDTRPDARIARHLADDDPPARRGTRRPGARRRSSWCVNAARATSTSWCPGSSA